MTERSIRWSDERIEPELPDHARDKHERDESSIVDGLESKPAGWNWRHKE